MKKSKKTIPAVGETTNTIPRLPSFLVQFLPRYLFVLAGFMLVLGISISLEQRRANSISVQKAIHNPAAPKTTPVPISEFDSYTATSDLARYIFIPKINVKAIVRSVGLAKDGSIGTPSNVFDTAWFNGSSKPGEQGATLIDGHVSSWTTNGVFYNLHLLVPGDLINIQRGDGAMLSYKVDKVQTYNASSINGSSLLQPVNPSKSGLNLITCTGDVIKGTNEFSQRLVVYSELE